MAVSDFFLWFVFYSVLGWIIETILCSIEERHLVKRGFLFGPYCPIYGVGSIVCLLLLGHIENPVFLFFAAMALCGLLEYVTGWLLEKLFHQKWWDYSDMPLNLHGRVCLPALLGFGALIVFLIKALHPFLLGFYVPYGIVERLVFTRWVAAFFALDIVLTVAKLKGFYPRMDHIRDKIGDSFVSGQEMKERLKVQLAEVSVRLPSQPLSHYARESRKKLDRFIRR